MSDAPRPFKTLEHHGRLVLFSPDSLSLAILPTDRSLPISPTAPDYTRDARRLGTYVGTRADSHDALDRLTIVVANTCNLNCSYCYAEGGRYYSKRRLYMDQETALRSLQWAAREFPAIAHLSFFGGEPTLNLEVIKLACHYVRFLVKKGILRTLPTFGLSTNGYLLDEPSLRFLEANHFSVTISLDGPREVHDRLRPTRAGHGSYDAVIRNAHRLLDAGIDLEIECTYTAEHLRSGIDIRDLMDFFYAVLGVHTLHCPVVAARPGAPLSVDLSACLRLQGDAIEYSVANLARGSAKALSTAVRLLGALDRRVPIPDYCPAGRSQLTINVDGAVYTCFMLMYAPHLSVAHTRARPGPRSGSRQGGAGHLLRERGGEAARALEHANKHGHAACLGCWARPLCFGCLGEDIRRFGALLRRSERPGESDFCDYRRGLIERLFRALADCHTAADNGVARPHTSGG